MRLGLETGFDSGLSLDHAYANRAAGRGVVGKALDRIYLSAPAWRAVRWRRAQAEAWTAEAVRAAAARRPRGSDAVHLLDVGAGCGRMALSVAASVGRATPEHDERGGNACGVRVTLLDEDSAGLARARTLAEAMGLGAVAYVVGDALAAGGFAGVDGGVAVALTSGLYEWCPDDASVVASLRRLAERMPPGGVLIYTGHPWHPQAALMARWLPSRRGGTCTMRRRSRAAWEALVAEAGFVTQRRAADRRRIFTVSWARRA